MMSHAAQTHLAGRVFETPALVHSLGGLFISTKKLLRTGLDYHYCMDNEVCAYKLSTNSESGNGDLVISTVSYLK